MVGKHGSKLLYDRGYVLCGIGSEAVATSFDVNDIQDEEIRNTLKTMFEEEFEKTVKGDKWTLRTEPHDS